MRKGLQQLAPDRLFLRFFTGWCLAALVEVGFNPNGFLDKQFFSSIVLWRFAAVLIGVTVAMTVFAFLRDTVVIETRLMTASAFIYCLSLAFIEHNLYFSLCLILVMLLIGIYVLQKDRLGLEHLQPSGRLVKALIAIAAVVFITFTAAVTICRYLGYYNATFDFGIFAQMFHYMKTTGLPLTTCERDELLSHFAVHISPIWYLLLPFYAVFPSPITLQVMQSLVLASAVIPLYLLAKEIGLSRRTILIVCVCFCFFPALSGGQFYDIHENCFLTPLLLWMLYFFEKKKCAPMWCFAILTLLVKEDAAIYVAAVALYLLCGRKEYKHGIALLFTSAAWFFIAIALLTRFGDGDMTATRFDNYLMNGDDGMLSVLKTVFLNPAYLFYQIFQIDKLKFLLQMLLPLTFLPLYGKKLSQLLLLIPLLVVNIMPNWQYQYSIYFQYVFGCIALLFYLTVLNLRALSVPRRRFMLPLAAVFTVLLSVSQLSGYANTITRYFDQYDVYQTITDTLELIPDDASVSASGFYLPAVSNRAIVYDLSADISTEYIVMDIRPANVSETEDKLLYYSSFPARYECVAWEEDIIAIYRDKVYIAVTP